MLKKALRSPPVQTVFGWLIAAYVDFVNLTTRWERVNKDVEEAVFLSGEGFIACAWHGRIPYCRISLNEKICPPVSVLVSQSRDGGMIAKAVEFMRAGTIRGSTAKGGKGGKGGAAALKAMIRHARSGGCVVVTPDGPRGPLMHFSPGALKAAQLAGKKVVLMAASSSGRSLMSSWDKTAVPKPFARGVCLMEGPFDPPPRGSDLEAEAARLGALLTALTRKADILAGVAPVEPLSAEAPAENAASPEQDAAMRLDERAEGAA